MSVLLQDIDQHPLADQARKQLLRHLRKGTAPALSLEKNISSEHSIRASQAVRAIVEILEEIERLKKTETKS